MVKISSYSLKYSLVFTCEVNMLVLWCSAEPNLTSARNL